MFLRERGPDPLVAPWLGPPGSELEDTIEEPDWDAPCLKAQGEKGSCQWCELTSRGPKLDSTAQDGTLVRGQGMLWLNCLFWRGFPENRWLRVKVRKVWWATTAPTHCQSPAGFHAALMRRTPRCRWESCRWLNSKCQILGSWNGNAGSLWQCKARARNYTCPPT